MEQKILALDNIASISQRFKRYGEKAQHTTPVMEAIVDDMLRIEGIVFNSNGRRGGGSWRKLKESTVARKGTTEILRTRGARPGYSIPGNDALFKSLTTRGAPHQIAEVTRYQIIFGTEVPGAGVTQATRPFLKFTAQDIDRWKGMIAEYILRTP